MLCLHITHVWNCNCIFEILIFLIIFWYIYLHIILIDIFCILHILRTMHILHIEHILHKTGPLEVIFLYFLSWLGSPLSLLGSPGGGRTHGPAVHVPPPPRTTTYIRLWCLLLHRKTRMESRLILFAWCTREPSWFSMVRMRALACARSPGRAASNSDTVNLPLLLAW